MRFNLIAYATTAVREIGKAMPPQSIVRRLVDSDCNPLGTCDVVENAIDHSSENLFCDPRSNEIEHDYVVPNPVKDFRAIQDHLEVPLDFSAHFASNI